MFKYIIFEEHSTTLIRVIIFDCITNHSTIKNRMEYASWKVISAGKLKWNMDGKLCCQRGSVTLGIEADAVLSIQDEEIINKLSEYY